MTRCGKPGKGKTATSTTAIARYLHATVYYTPQALGLMPTVVVES
jgi:hypothetical protein